MFGSILPSVFVLCGESGGQSTWLCISIVQDHHISKKLIPTTTTEETQCEIHDSCRLPTPATNHCQIQLDDVLPTDGSKCIGVDKVPSTRKNVWMLRGVGLRSPFLWQKTYNRMQQVERARPFNQSCTGFERSSNILQWSDVPRNSSFGPAAVFLWNFA